MQSQEISTFPDDFPGISGRTILYFFLEKKMLGNVLIYKDYIVIEILVEYTNRILFEILINETVIRLYLQCTMIDLEQQTDAVRLLFQINRGKR